MRMTLWNFILRHQQRGNFLRYSRFFNYVQGQSPEPNTREYFYYIDHQGMLFLDDSKMKNFTSCFKDKKFLEFFFKRLRMNNTGKYEKAFPFYSPCGHEKNFVRCDDLPIVFTEIMECKNNENEYIEYLSYAHTGKLLKVVFKPEKIYMLPTTGRIYHPGPEATGGVGLIKSSLAIQLSQNFIYKNPNNTDEAPEFFIWKDKKYSLSKEVLKNLKISPIRKIIS